MVPVRWAPEPQNSNDLHDYKFHREIMQTTYPDIITLLTRALAINLY